MLVAAGSLPGAQISVRASAGGLPLLGDHARLSAGVARRMPMRCVSAWASSGRCPSPVCGFPAVWVVCRGVRCGLRLVVGEGAGAGAGRRRMPRGRWRPALGGGPRRRPPRRRASPAPFWRLSVGWLSSWTVIGRLESALWEGCYPALTGYLNSRVVEQ